VALYFATELKLSEGDDEQADKIKIIKASEAAILE
jgi:hypothetical protein